MSKTNKILLAVVVILVVVVAVVAYYIIFGGSYWAVYTKSGEIYFGQISHWPQLALSDVYLLQLTGDEKNPFLINRFDRSVWGPEDKIYLNSDNIVWRAKVSKESQLLDYFQNPEKYQQQLPASGQSGVAPTGGEQLPPSGGEEGGELPE